MTDQIVMRHPGLPAEQEITVHRDAMPHYSTAGWQQVPQDELDERAARAAAAVAEALAAEREQQEPAAQEQAVAEPGPIAAPQPAEAAADVPDTSEPAEPRRRPARRATVPQSEES